MLTLVMCKSKDVYLRLAVAVGLLGNFIALLWAAISHRPTFADGTFWYFAIFDSHRFFWDHNLIRAISASIEAPAVFLLWLFPSSIPIAGYVLSFSFLLHPFLSLGACALLLRKFGRPELIYFPLSSFVFCTMGLMAYPSLVVPETLSFYWPLLLLLMLREGKTLWEWPVVLCLLIALMFAYESALIFCVINILALALRMKRKYSRGDFILLVLNLGIFGFLLWRLHEAPAFSKDHFWQAITNGLVNFRFFSLFGALIVVTFTVLELIIPQQIKPWLVAASGLALIGVAIPFFYFIANSVNWPVLIEPVWAARTTAIPVAALFALLAIYLHFLRRQVNSTILLLFLSFALLTTCIHDVIITYEWKKTYATIQQLREENPGCNVLSADAYQHIFKGITEVGGDWLPFHSISAEHSSQVTSLFFVEDNPSGASCVLNSDGLLVYNRASLLYVKHAKKIRFEPILSQPIRVHRWNSSTQKIEIEILKKTPLGNLL